MCTATWLWEPAAGPESIEPRAGYQLFFNRDELRSRLPAAPPAVHAGDAPDGGPARFLAPTDGDHGGSWIAVNRAGLTVAVLNSHPAGDWAPDPRRRISRGLLVTDLAVAGDLPAVLARLDRLELPRYRPFTLLLLAPGDGARTADWDGRRLAVTPDDELTQPLASSSRDEPGVGTVRRELLAEALGGAPLSEAATAATPPLLLEFHRSHRPERGVYSPCMHREDARTVSFTWVGVRPQEVRMRYAGGPPCSVEVGAALTLQRHSGS